MKVALELHPQNIVFNTADVRKLIELTGATHVGVELDASHLFWQQMDPVAVVRELGPLVFQAAAKDVRVNTGNAALYGVLDNSFRRLARGNRTNLGGDEWANEWPKNSAWDFVAWAAGTTPPTGPSSCARCTRWTPTCSSTSSTRTSRWAGSRASRSRPGPARRRRGTLGLAAPGSLTRPANHEVAGTLPGRRASGDPARFRRFRRRGARTPRRPARRSLGVVPAQGLGLEIEEVAGLDGEPGVVDHLHHKALVVD